MSEGLDENTVFDPNNDHQATESQEQRSEAGEMPQDVPSTPPEASSDSWQGDRVVRLGRVSAFGPSLDDFSI